MSPQSGIINIRNKFLTAILICHCTIIYAQDSLLVVNFYHATNGEKWINNNNWLSEKPLDEWFGLTVSGSFITEIDLPRNHLEGNLPNDLCKISSLKRINLSDNDLTGTLPDSIGYLDELEIIDLSHNDLTGSFDKLFTASAELKYLDLSHNQFDGRIPRNINKSTKLEFLNLSNNRLNGKIPLDLFRLYNLNKLDLHNNKFSGSIPRQIGSLIQLKYLDLSRNNFSGAIPKEIGKLINLTERLALNHNDLSGEIPSELCQLTELKYLWLNNNKISGILPFDIGKLNRLKSLFIYQNELVGPLPRSIGNLREMEIFYAQNNSFGGQIPNELWFLPKLKMLKFENNNLTGSIPGDLRILKAIQAIDLSNNNISTINDAIALPNSIITLNLSNNRLFCSESIAVRDNSLSKIVGIESQNCVENDWVAFALGTDEITFQSVATDSSAAKYFTITSSNARSNLIQIKNFDMTNFIVPDSLIKIEQDDTINVEISFSPISEGTYNDVIFIEDVVSNQNNFILVSGEGIEPGLPDRDPTIPWRYNLHPIPFSDGSEIIIKYDVPKSSVVDIAIYNLGGRPIKSIVNKSVETGYHELIWDGNNDNGEKVEPAEYLCVMQSGMFIQIQPLLILY